MTINLQKPDITELKPRITVFGVGGGGGNAVNNMINCGLDGVEFVVANTDAQALTMNKAERIIQLGMGVTEGLGAGSMPEVGRAAAEECIDEINDHLSGTHMCFVTAGMGGGTGTGAAPVVARAAREKGILTVGVVTKPFHFEGQRRMRTADSGIDELQANVDTLIVIPNQNLFRIANDKTTFADAFSMADQVLFSGVACITDLMVKEGLINLDFADVRSVMRDMGKAMMGTGESSGEGRAMSAAEAAIANPLLDETSMKGARGLLISITGGRDMTLFEVDEAATRIREEVDQDANIILGATFDESLEGIIRVSVVATGIDAVANAQSQPSAETRAIPRAVTGAKPAEKAPQQPMPAAAAKPAQPMPSQLMAAPRGTSTPDLVAQTQPPSTSQRPEMPDLASEMERFAAPLAASPSRQVEETTAAEAAPRSTLFTPPPQPAAPATQPVQREMPAPRQMPRVEDFPAVAQPLVERASAPTAEAPIAHEDDERGPLGLLRRLTNGLSAKREDEEVEVPSTEDRAAPVMNDELFGNTPSQPRRELSQDAAMYAPRSGQLDGQGRKNQGGMAATAEDTLEIPAFLRRQVR
ncbi:MAG: cell division protein FtsZ [Pseudomonadota bacterium]